MSSIEDLQDFSNPNCACDACQLSRRLFVNQRRMVGIMETFNAKPNLDVFRLLLVFNHSMVEDFFREVIRLRWARGEADWLKDISLPKAEGSKTKFTIYDLTEYRSDQTIGDLVSQSVESHLQSVSFNSSRDVARWLNRLGYDVSLVEGLLKHIDKGMQKRHKIVHEADMGGDGIDSEPNIIDGSVFVNYFDATSALLVYLIANLRMGSDWESAHPENAKRVKDILENVSRQLKTQA